MCGASNSWMALVPFIVAFLFLKIFKPGNGISNYSGGCSTTLVFLGAFALLAVVVSLNCDVPRHR
jgi:hypothetical protein